MSQDKAGVLTIAFGKPKYLEYAFTLMGSIKMADPEIRTAIVMPDSMKNHPLWFAISKVFDIVLPLPKEVTHHNGEFAPGRIKLQLNKISPFEKTLFLDSDSVVFPTAKFTKEFNRLLARDLAYHCWRQYPRERVEMIGESCVWGPLVPYIDAFGMKGPRFDEVSSYFFYWRDTERTQEYFAKALEIHDGIAAGELQRNDKEWHTGWVPDEYPLTLATGITGIYSDFGVYRPFADLNDKKHRDMKAIEKLNIGITLPGGSANNYWINWYNKYARAVSGKFGIYKPFLFDGK